MRFASGVFLVLLLLGCANPQEMRNKELQKMMDSWIGAPEEAVISRWGAPTSTYQTNNMKFLTFIEGGPTILYRGAAFPLQCKTTFGVRDGRIATWQTAGNC